MVCKQCWTDLRFYSPLAFKKDAEKTEFGIEVELYLSEKLIFIFIDLKVLFGMILCHQERFFTIQYDSLPYCNDLTHISLTVTEIISMGKLLKMCLLPPDRTY